MKRIVLLVAVAGLLFLPLLTVAQTDESEAVDEILQALDHLSDRLTGFERDIAAESTSAAEIGSMIGDLFDAFSAVLTRLPEIYDVPFSHVFTQLYLVLDALSEVESMYYASVPTPYEFLDELHEAPVAVARLRNSLGLKRLSDAMCQGDRALVTVLPGFDGFELRSKIHELLGDGTCVTVTWHEPDRYLPESVGASGPVQTALVGALSSDFKTGPAFEITPFVPFMFMQYDETYAFGDESALHYSAQQPAAPHEALERSGLELETDQDPAITMVDPSVSLKQSDRIRPWYEIKDLCDPVDIEWRYFAPDGSLASTDTESLDPTQSEMGCLDNYMGISTKSLMGAFGQPGEYVVELWFGGVHSATHTFRMAGSTTGFPIAFDDLYSTNEDTPLINADPGVLANDADPGGSLLTVEIVYPASHGTVSLQPDGHFDYTPKADYSGVDRFAYRITNSEGHSAQAQATILVLPMNDAPTARDDTLSLDVSFQLSRWRLRVVETGWTTSGQLDGNGGFQASIPPPGLLANDADLDGDRLSIILDQVTTPEWMTVNADGSVDIDVANAAHVSPSLSILAQATDSDSRSSYFNILWTANLNWDGQP